MRALSIRQPYAELILRGIKRIEYRSKPTHIIGERFYIYASKKESAVAGNQLPVKAWSDDLQVAMPPAWMIELAEQMKLIEADALLPKGVIVGSAVIEKCEEVAGYGLRVAGWRAASGQQPSTSNHQPATLYQWHLAGVERARTLRRPTGHPQPVWFTPF